MNAVPDEKVWTADELLAMTPNERHATVKASIVTDLDEVPPEFLERVRANIREHIAATEGTTTDPT